METLENKLEEIINQLTNENKEFAQNLNILLQSLSLTSSSETIRNHIKSLSQKCLEDPKKSKNIFKFYLKLLKSNPRSPCSNTPSEISKLLSITNISSSSNFTVRLFPGQELKHSINLTEIFLKIEKTLDSSPNNLNFKIFIKENNLLSSRVLIHCNGSTLKPGQFFLIKNSLICIKSLNNSEVKAEFFPDIFNQLQNNGFNLQGLEHHEFIFEERNFRYDIFNNLIVDILHIFETGFVVTKEENDWIIKYQKDNVYLYLGNPLECGFQSEYFDLSSQKSEFFIDSAAYKVEILTGN
jgi:hypothetical protein